MSTEEQALEGISLDAQSSKINGYCELHSLNLIAIHADEGLSGKRADNRPALRRALDAVCEEKGVLVVYPCPGWPGARRTVSRSRSD